MIKQDPENENYWLYLHIFSRNNEQDNNMNKKALFKAYDINPSNELVLNSLIAYYFHTCDYVKFFKVL